LESDEFRFSAPDEIILKAEHKREANRDRRKYQESDYGRKNEKKGN